MNSTEKNSKTLPVKKTIRSKLIQRVRTTRNTPTFQVEKNGQDAVAINRLPVRGQADAISKVPRGIRKNSEGL